MRVLFGFPTGRETRPVDSASGVFILLGERLRQRGFPPGDIKKRQDSAPSRGGGKRDFICDGEMGTIQGE